MIRIIPENTPTNDWMAADSRVHRTYGTKESRKEGRSSDAIYLAKTPTRGIGCYRSSMKRCGMTDSEACQWDEPAQTAEHKSSRCGPAMSVAKHTTTKLEKPNYNMSRDYESYY